MGHPCNIPTHLTKENKHPFVHKSLLEYGIDSKMWLLLSDECSQPQESHDGCFNFRTFLISGCLLPSWTRSYRCHHCKVLCHWDNLKLFAQPWRWTSFWMARDCFSKAKIQISDKHYWECLLIISPCEEATIFFLSSTVASRLQSEGYLLYREPRNMRK